MLLATGHDPLPAYRQIFDAAFVNNGAIGQTLIAATPLAFTGLAAAAAFRMRLFNIGGEGQLTDRRDHRRCCGLYFGGLGWPKPIVDRRDGGRRLRGRCRLGAVPGVLRAFFKTNEIITSLMLNYVAAYLLTYLVFNTNSYWRETKGFNAVSSRRARTCPATRSGLR